MLVSFSIIPLGVGESLGESISRVIDLVDRSGLPYRTHAMGTVIEGSWEEAMALVKECHDAIRRDGLRVYTTIAIDDRPGAMNRLEGKIDSVEKHLGRSIRK